MLYDVVTDTNEKLNNKKYTSTYQQFLHFPRYKIQNIVKIFKKY